MNKSDLLNAFTSKPIKTLEDIPGLPGVTLHIATLSAYTAQHLYNDELREKMMADKAFLAALFVASVCDENGELIFTNDDIEAINKMPFPAIKHVTDEIAYYNGLIDPESVKSDAKKN